MEDIPKLAKAAVIVKHGEPLEIREYPIPDPEPGAILVRQEMAGVCGSDVHHWRGELFVGRELPAIPGHEFLGRIVKMGEGIKGDSAGEPLRAGDRIMWAHVDCGECYWCRIALQPNLCARRELYGFRSCSNPPHLMGGFAEYIYLIPKTQVIKVPDELTNEEAIGVCCAGRTAASTYETISGGARVQETVVIQGAGPVGLYSCVLFREGGASKVIVIGAPQNRLELAKKWGADHVVNIDELKDANKRKEMVFEWTKGIGADVVVEASGAHTAVPEGLEMVRRGGRYAISGPTDAFEVNIKPAVIVGKHLEIRGVYGATITHYYKMLKFIKNKRDKYPFAEIVTGKYGLEQATEALKDMASYKGIKPVVIP